MDNKAYEVESGGQEMSEISPEGDVTVDVGDSVNKPGLEDGEDDYIGLSREELLEYSTKPSWVIARWTIVILLIVGWVGIIIGAIYIMVSTPTCLPWWETAVFYQVYPRSFKDTDDNGIGDLAGIEEKMDYIEDIGVNAIWMNSIYKSPQVDNGNDISDYYDIDPLFGDVNEFELLLLTLKQRGLRVILDFIPNHSSQHHAWFNESRKSLDNDYKSHYIWVDGAEGTPPNNWLSVWGGSAWTYDDERGQYYLHQFLKEQPDLNWRNNDVKKEFDNILDYWLKKGVDGFRINAVQHLLETEDYSQDELPNPEYSGTDPGYDYDSLLHNYTKEYEGIHDIVRGWRSGEMDYYSTTGAYRFLTSEAYDDLDVVASYYGLNGQETNFPHNLNFLEIIDNGRIFGYKVKEMVAGWLESMPSGKHPNFLLGNHDKPRIASHVGQNHARSCHILLLTLPGSPTIYYGDEIGMEDIIVTEENLQDPAAKGDPSKSRDGARSPMQWSTENHAGFSNSSSTWLPVNPNYETVNVEAQSSDDKSVLNLFKALTSLRSGEERVFPVGSISYTLVDDDIFSYIRESTLSGYNRYLVTINFGDSAREDDYFEQEESLPIEGEVVVSSLMDRNGKTVQLNKLFLDPGEGLVIKI